MTIQDFNQALNEQGSSDYETFAVLRQARVRAVLDDPADGGPVATPGWHEWAVG